MNLKDLNSFFIGCMVGLIALSTLIANQYGFTFQIIKDGFWSIAYCLKPHTLIIYPAFGIMYYLLLGECQHRIEKTIAVLFLGFLIQDSAYMYFYMRYYSTSATWRNIFLYIYCLFVLNSSGKELHLRKVIMVSLLSLALLYVYSTSGYISLEMSLPSFVIVDSLLKIIPLCALLVSFPLKK